ncbi:MULTISPECIES: hypothetical protein [unclassified Streptomyces]|uniref:hypothetical protein n=1 Tax=unclassified Streptomyces TaxID=2593676 RepID=UPI0038215ED8
MRDAAPSRVAPEVADRRHLLQNLGAAVAKTCHQHRSCLRKQAEEEKTGEDPGDDQDDEWRPPSTPPRRADAAVQ